MKKLEVGVDCNVCQVDVTLSNEYLLLLVVP